MIARTPSPAPHGDADLDVRTDLPRLRAADARRGFTLIELLVVIAILGILGTIVVHNVWGHVDEAKQKAAKAKVDNIDQQVQMYKRKHNEIPRDLRTLLDSDPLNNNEAWVEEEQLEDPWGNALAIKIDGNRFEIVSFGEGGADDGFGLDLGLARDIGSHHPLEPPKDGGGNH
jgi:general secretion pathway protein G